MSGIPIRVYLDRDTFLVLERKARAIGADGVGALLAHGARRMAGSVVPPATRGRPARYTRDVIDQWVEAAKLGVTNTAIAKQWGVDISTVSKQLIRRGVRRQRAHGSRGERA